MSQHADRNQQFENIARLKQQYLEYDNPILSVDTKKKELVLTSTATAISTRRRFLRSSDMISPVRFRVW